MFSEPDEGSNSVPENKETSYCSRLYSQVIIVGSHALSAVMLLLRIIENDKINAYFRAG